jgi:hypothetical protein
MSFTEHSNLAGKLLQDRGAVASAQALPRQSVAADPIGVGTIFIEEGTPVPDSLVFDSAPYSEGWRSVKNLNGYDLDRKIRSAGWNLFDLSNVNATVFGFDREKAVHSAVKRALAKTKSDNFNALEISQVAAKRFLGLSCVTVYARMRHVQESMFLLHDKELARRNQVRLVSSRADRGGQSKLTS